MLVSKTDSPNKIYKFKATVIKSKFKWVKEHEHGKLLPHLPGVVEVLMLFYLYVAGRPRRGKSTEEGKQGKTFFTYSIFRPYCDHTETFSYLLDNNTLPFRLSIYKLQ